MSDAKPNTKAVICAILANKEGKILLLQRADTRKEYPEKWGFVSGFIEADETPEQCLYREIKEELGEEITFSLLRIGEAFEIKEPVGMRKIYPYLIEYAGGDILLEKEHAKYEWIELADLYNFDIIPTLGEDIKHLHLDKLTFSIEEQIKKKEEHKKLIESQEE